jgi:bacteriorhodopsin
MKMLLLVLGVAIGIGVGGILLFTLIGWAWYAFGVFGALIIFGGLLILMSWLIDRRRTPSTY